MNRKKKGKYIGLAGALLVHVVVIALLILVGFTLPEQSEEGGVPVMMGETPDAWGAADPSLVEVETMPEEAAPEMPEEADQEMLTQEDEETVAIKPKAEEKKKEVKKPEKSAAEKAEEARKLAAEKAERERKAAEEAARKRVAGAFGKGAQMGSKGATEGTGVQGSPTGNSFFFSSALGFMATAGTGGYGTFNLGGRSIGEGGLPRPVYNVQDEGKVVVTITVNPAGQVIGTSINRQTNTVNPALRKAAEDAAKKARFNTVSGLSNQTGTITYYFNLK